MSSPEHIDQNLDSEVVWTDNMLEQEMRAVGVNIERATSIMRRFGNLAYTEQGRFDRNGRATVFAFARLICSLGQKLPKANTIIADFMSGEYPALFFLYLLEGMGKNPVYKTYNYDRRGSDGNVHDHHNGFAVYASMINDITNDPPLITPPVLCVTETVAGGEHMARLTQALYEEGISHDVVTVAGPQWKERREGLPLASYDRRIKGHYYCGVLHDEDGATVGADPSKVFEFDNMAGSKHGKTSSSFLFFPKDGSKWSTYTQPRPKPQTPEEKYNVAEMQQCMKELAAMFLPLAKKMGKMSL